MKKSYDIEMRDCPDPIAPDEPCVMLTRGTMMEELRAFAEEHLLGFQILGPESKAFIVTNLFTKLSLLGTSPINPQEERGERDPQNDAIIYTAKALEELYLIGVVDYGYYLVDQGITPEEGMKR